MSSLKKYVVGTHFYLYLYIVCEIGSYTGNSPRYIYIITFNYPGACRTYNSILSSHCVDYNHFGCFGPMVMAILEGVCCMNSQDNKVVARLTEVGCVLVAAACAVVAVCRR